ncbi:hypothetical protein SEA_MALISHA_33 [Gordonia phage Malisha]|nr:hypothetical protein SEA_MALISHA_33 [Gordonia phage Malisha]
MPTVTFTVEGPGAGTGTLWFKPRENFTTPDGEIVTTKDSRRTVPYTLNVEGSVVLPEGPWQATGLATKHPVPFDVTSAGGDLKDLIVFPIPASAPVTTLSQAVTAWMAANVNTEVTDPILASLVEDETSQARAAVDQRVVAGTSGLLSQATADATYAKVPQSSTPPISPAVGDLWLDTSA